jgi:competence protein ComEC
MVDCGGSSDSMAADAAAETLLSQGISKLDGLILTHYDKDHAGGLENLLSRIDVDMMILPPVYSAIPLKSENILYACEDLVLTADQSEIYIYTALNAGTSNEMSLCILFDTENCDILITGDRNLLGEHALLQRNSIGDVDVLVAGHHGSADSTGDELLAAVRPEIVCISAGVGNIYGHPHRELLRRLESHGCTVYRTDLHGDIVIRR